MLIASSVALAATKEEEKAEVSKAGKEALAAVYKLQPSARKAVESAAGYAAFSNFGMKILFAGGGSGKGIAVDNKTKATTYMKMVEVQAGLGMGVKKFQLVWVFETEKALERLRQLGMGVWWAGDRSGEGRRERCVVSGGGRGGPGGLALPGHKRRTGSRTDCQGNEILQGPRSQLIARGPTPRARATLRRKMFEPLIEPLVPLPPFCKIPARPELGLYAEVVFDAVRLVRREGVAASNQGDVIGIRENP